MHATQDRVIGNQQRGMFWERIVEHYEQHKVGGRRPMRLLEMKWGQIKHNVVRFIGVYKQCVDLQKSAIRATDTLKKAHELFRQRSKSGTNDF